MNVKLTKAQKIRILNSDDLYGIMQRILLRENKIDRNREHFWVIGLENNNRILFIELISKGTVNKTLVKPMEVFSLALQKRAVSIILCHNHPSGELTPSEADKDITDRLIQTGNIVNTAVTDHLIISEKSYLSFADTALLEVLEKSTRYVPNYVLVQQLKKEAKKARELGIKAEKAKETGMKAGKKKKAVEMAKAMKADGEPVEKIRKYTGLSVADIKKIKVGEMPGEK